MKHFLIINIRKFFPSTKNNSMETKTKKVEIEIPAGKNAVWVNGVLTLVDEKPQDATERIKTFADACRELDSDHPFVKAYDGETYTDRMKIEKEELYERMARLDKFIRSENFDNLDEEEQLLLFDQFGAMMSYFQILKRRIAKAEN